MKTDSSIAAKSESLWIYNPPLDLIVGCGAWSAPLLLLTYYAADSSTLAWSVAFYALALFFNFPHYMATIYRAYHTREDFEKYRIFTLHITAIIVVTLLLSHFWFKALPWIFTLYLTWSPWHYSGQNYGLFMMFTRRSGATPSNVERRALHTAFLLSYLVLFVNFHSGVSQDPLFRSLGIPPHVGDVLVSILGIAFLGCAIFGWRNLPGQTGWKPLVPAMTLFATQFLWFLLPTVLSLVGRLQIPQSRYSTGVMAIMHSAQYLWITSYYARRESDGKKASAWRPFVYFGILITGGIALFIPGPWLASRLFHYDFTASFLIFTALVNIHHFILDGAIWKLRDGRIAALLLNSQAGLAKAKSNAASGVRWIVGPSAAAKTLRMAAACALLTLAIVDQTRYFLSLHRESLSDLQVAAALNSFDSSLQSRIARKELQLGDSDAAVAAWQAAVNTNPADTEKRDMLLNFLIQNKKTEEAYQLATMCLKRTPSDANLLVNHGILASQLGHGDIAAASWKRAIQVDSSQRQAKLYLAQELQKEGKAETAIPYYIAYLDDVARAGAKNRPSPVDTVVVLLRLASCQVQAKNLRDAAHSYELAEKIAAEGNEKKLESFASVSLALVKANEGDNSAALPLYQHALKLDDGLGDRKVEATDWYNYAMLLKQAKYPDRLVYACLAKSESLAGAEIYDSDQVLEIAAAKEEAAYLLAKEDAHLKRDPRLAIDEALTLK